ncbi:MAG: hypothetical protein E7057_02705 [Lentisphaerae bacterium]|nr:hypothetical protein [Lentisphaerota bacterium]
MNFLQKALPLALCCVSLITAAAERKKIVATGFSSLTPKQLLQHQETMEQYCPIDGICLHFDIRKTINGKEHTIYRHSIFSGLKWERSFFDEDVAALKQVKFKKWTDNFVYMATTKCNFGLFDDAAWETVFNNVGILAQVAKECGLKGIFMDIEHYGGDKYHPIFQYDPASGKTFEESYAKARQRGRQMIQAMTRHFPDIRIIAVLGTYAINFPSLASADLKEDLKNQMYGLSPAFFDGMFEKLPPQAKLYDGTELVGYTSSLRTDYYKIVNDHYTLTPKLAAPELWQKILLQSGIAIPFYLDAYYNTKGFWQVKSPLMERMPLFRRNLHHALNASAEYVWLYYETPAKWWPFTMLPYYENAHKRAGGGKARLWPEILPGLFDAIDAARDPLSYAKKQFAAGKAKTVWKADFENGKVGLNVWLSGKKGTVTVTPEKHAKFSGVTFGSMYSNRIPVKAGELYLVRAKVKHENGITPGLSMHFYTNKGQKVLEQTERPSVAFTEPLADGWKMALFAIFIPDEAEKIEIHAGVRSYHGKTALFDDMEFFLIP